MKRRNYLICSIIAILSIVSYACETEYAICEGCGTSEDGNEPSENVCEDDDIQKCAENLNGKQVCEGGKWEDDAACNYCFNENEDNSGTNSLVCEECTPNSYNSTGTEVCYKGAFREFKSKDLDENDPNSGVVKNTDPKSDDAPWEFAYNNSGSLKYYNCHNDSVFKSMQPGSGWGGAVDRKKSCCKENDYYIKHIGYKYYSIEKCVKVEEKDVPAGFMAYKYTDELNDSLIGQKSKLPYGFCYNDDIFLAVDGNVVEGKSVFHRYECESGSKCSDNFNGLCIINGVSIDENKDFKCEIDLNSTKKTPFVIKSGDDIIATCPAGTELKIKVDNGTWSNVDCTRRIFKLDKVRCAPI